MIWKGGQGTVLRLRYPSLPQANGLNGVSQNGQVGNDLCVIPQTIFQITQRGTAHRPFPTGKL